MAGNALFRCVHVEGNLHLSKQKLIKMIVTSAQQLFIIGILLLIKTEGK